MPSTGNLNQSPTKSTSVVLVDVGLAPLVNHLDLIPAYRIYLIAQQLNRSTLDGRGWLTVADLHQALANFGLDYSPRRFEMLIKEGSDLFWRIRPCERGRKGLYLAGYIRVWERLGKRLFRVAPDLNLLDAYRPIKYAAIVDVSGSLQQFKSRLYAAWIETRHKSETFHASREFVSTLWNVCDNTLRQWESLSPVNVTPCYAEYAGNDPRFRPPKHAYLYARKDGSLAITWQLPNTYSIKPGQTIERHGASGQSRKARKAHNQVIKALKSIQPLEQIGEGIAVPGRMYFEKVKNAYETCKTIRKLIQRLSRRHEDSTTPRYIFLGSKTTRRGRLQIYESYDMNAGFPHIDLNDRDYLGERSPEFRLLKSASLEFGLTWGLRQMRWKSARKKTEPPVLVEYAQGQVGEGDPPKNRLDIIIQSDPLLKLGQKLGAEIHEAPPGRSRSVPLLCLPPTTRPISPINAMLLRRDLAKKIKNFRYTTSFPRKL
ncbi:MAG TPA: hypothetical protein VHL11_07840, partial [Phototrophicaceae bacterium]|nr:hypothetical protein [Phototrophicaceae bacterium]